MARSLLGTLISRFCFHFDSVPPCSLVTSSVHTYAGNWLPPCGCKKSKKGRNANGQIPSFIRGEGEGKKKLWTPLHLSVLQRNDSSGRSGATLPALSSNWGLFPSPLPPLSQVGLVGLLDINDHTLPTKLLEEELMCHRARPCKRLKRHRAWCPIVRISYI